MIFRYLSLLPACLMCIGAAEARMSIDRISSRVAFIDYEPSTVLTIGGIPGYPFLIELSNEDFIEDVAGGRISDWDIVKRKNRLFIRALPKAKDATVIVTTAKRSYVVDLRPLKSTPENLLTHMSKLVVHAIVPPPKEVEVRIEHDETEVTPLRYKNTAYTMQILGVIGDISPREVYDDGRFTYFKFPNNIQIPAIYRRASLDTNDEWIVNWHIEGEYTVIHAVSPYWTIRLNGAVIGIFNENFQPEGQKTVDGTTVPGLKRVDK